MNRLKKYILSIEKWIDKNTVTSVFCKGILKGSINTRATSIAFHFFMAMLPTVIFFFSLIPHIPMQGLFDASKELVGDLLPDKTRYSIEAIINQFAVKPGGIQVFSVFFALMFSMNGVNGVISAFNSSYHTIETRTWLQKRKISIFLVAFLFILIVTSVFLIVFSKYFIQFLIIHDIVNKKLTIFLLQIGKWFILSLMILMTISTTYYLAPADKKNWKFISTGSLFATTLTIIASLIFSFVMNKFGKFNQLFGPLGTIIVVLLWIYFNALALLLGFELNASINSNNRNC